VTVTLRSSIMIGKRVYGQLDGVAILRPIGARVTGSRFKHGVQGWRGSSRLTDVRSDDFAKGPLTKGLRVEVPLVVASPVVRSPVRKIQQTIKRHPWTVAARLAVAKPFAWSCAIIAAKRLRDKLGEIPADVLRALTLGLCLRACPPCSESKGLLHVCPPGRCGRRILFCPEPRKGSHHACKRWWAGTPSYPRACC